MNKKTVGRKDGLSIRAANILRAALELDESNDYSQVVTLNFVCEFFKRLKMDEFKISEERAWIVGNELRCLFVFKASIGAGKTYEELMRWLDVSGITQELINEEIRPINTMSKNQAIGYLEDALARIRKPSQNSRGAAWQAGGCYWRLMKVVRFYVEPALAEIEGVDGAKRLKEIHGEPVGGQ